MDYRTRLGLLLAFAAVLAASVVGVPVTVHGMKVNSGDLIHADQHGAIVVPLDIVDKMKPALDDLNAREAREIVFVLR